MLRVWQWKERGHDQWRNVIIMYVYTCDRNTRAQAHAHTYTYIYVHDYNIGMTSKTTAVAANDFDVLDGLVGFVFFSCLFFPPISDFSRRPLVVSVVVVRVVGTTGSSFILLLWYTISIIVV